MQEGILGVEKEAYFNSYSDSLREGAGTQCIMMPRRPDWDAF